MPTRKSLTDTIKKAVESGACSEEEGAAMLAALKKPRKKKLAARKWPTVSNSPADEAMVTAILNRIGTDIHAKSYSRWAERLDLSIDLTKRKRLYVEMRCTNGAYDVLGRIPKNESITILSTVAGSRYIDTGYKVTIRTTEELHNLFKQKYDAEVERIEAAHEAKRKAEEAAEAEAQARSRQRMRHELSEAIGHKSDYLCESEESQRAVLEEVLTAPSLTWDTCTVRDGSYSTEVEVPTPLGDSTKLRMVIGKPSKDLTINVRAVVVYGSFYFGSYYPIELNLAVADPLAKKVVDRFNELLKESIRKAKEAARLKELREKEAKENERASSERLLKSLANGEPIPTE